MYSLFIHIGIKSHNISDTYKKKIFFSHVPKGEKRFGLCHCVICEISQKFYKIWKFHKIFVKFVKIHTSFISYI